MTMEGTIRKLTAILSADAVGYSRLMAEDEIGTIQRLKLYRELISVRIREHHGRVVDSPGDNLLAEFPSALDATRCAVEIQGALINRNADLPANQRMEFRIGTHLGDVMVDGDRIYGNGVNIAARLEGLADPGGICISATVHEQVRGKLDIEFNDIGLQAVKNIPEPVRIYKIQTASKVLTETQKERRISVVSEKPCIAVLPFVNMSDDTQQEYFSDGISEDILNGLAKNPELDVIARTSAFHFKGQNQDVRTIGKQLNATHLVEGSVRKFGNRIRVTAQLVNADRGTHLWSEQYNRELIDVFEVQDEIAGSILKELNIQLVDSDEKQARTANMEAYDACLLGYYHENSVPLALDKAKASYERAVTLDPNYADAYGALARLHIRYAILGLTSVQKELPIVREHIDNALSINPNQPDALTAQTWIHYLNRNYQDAIDEVTELAQKYPNDMRVLVAYIYVVRIIDMFDMALTISDRMVKLNQLLPDAHLIHGANLFHLGRLDDARQSFERFEMISNMPNPLGFAYIALCEKDIEGIQKQLDRGQTAWSDPITYAIYEAVVSNLKGDYRKVKEILAPLWQTANYIPYITKRNMAAIEGDLDLAIDYWAQALSESEYFAFQSLHLAGIIGTLFPEYRSRPKYQQMLHNVGLDDESIEKLKIPPLPF